jgi:hypothetical protein
MHLCLKESINMLVNYAKKKVIFLIINLIKNKLILNNILRFDICDDLR